MTTRKRATLIGAAAAAFLLLATVAIAALITRANVDQDATTANLAIRFTSSATNSGGNPSGTIDTVNSGNGTCTASLSSGDLSVTLAGIWSDTECVVGELVTTTRLWVENLSGQAIDVSPDYPIGFGAPGSGEPIEVEWLDGSDTPIVFPLTLSAANHTQVKLRYTVNAATADPNTNYTGQLGLQP